MNTTEIKRLPKIIALATALADLLIKAGLVEGSLDIDFHAGHWATEGQLFARLTNSFDDMFITLSENGNITGDQWGRSIDVHFDGVTLPAHTFDFLTGE